VPAARPYATATIAVVDAVPIRHVDKTPAESGERVGGPELELTLRAVAQPLHDRSQELVRHPRPTFEEHIERRHGHDERVDRGRP
jgi:hypothetical protein